MIQNGLVAIGDDLMKAVPVMLAVRFQTFCL